MPATPTSEGDNRSSFPLLGSLGRATGSFSSSSSSLSEESSYGEGGGKSSSTTKNSSSSSNLRLPSPASTSSRRRHTPSLDTIADAAQSPPRRSTTSSTHSISRLPTAVLSNSTSQPRTPTRRANHHVGPSENQKTSPTSMAAGGSFLGRLLGKNCSSAMKGRRVMVAQAGREEEEEEGEFVVL